MGRFTICRLLAIFTVLITVVSCSKDDGLEIQHNFPFEVDIMPVPKEIANGEIVEIRVALQQSGNYSGAEYFLRISNLREKVRCGIRMIRRISPMIPMLYRHINFDCIILRNPPYQNPLIFGFQITSEMRNRLVFSLITKTE